jgi:hypothetical protein
MQIIPDQWSFIGGKPTFPDPNYVHGYEEIPYYIVSKIVKKSEKSSPEAFRIESKQVWNKMLHEYAVGLPAKVASRYYQIWP